MSYARSRQNRNRAGNGRYKDGPKCELCGKPAGHEYLSDPRVDSCDVWGGVGLVLDARCADLVGRLPSASALLALRPRLKEAVALVVDFAEADAQAFTEDEKADARYRTLIDGLAVVRELLR